VGPLFEYVEYVLSFLAGTMVLHFLSAVMTPPAILIPSDNGTASRRTRVFSDGSPEGTIGYSLIMFTSSRMHERKLNLMIAVIMVVKNVNIIRAHRPSVTYTYIVCRAKFIEVEDSVMKQ
jgi:hypothetical protein